MSHPAIQRARAILNRDAEYFKRQEEARERNRQEMPETAMIVDLFRQQFKSVRVVWAKENGKEVGNAT